MGHVRDTGTPSRRHHGRARRATQDELCAGIAHGFQRPRRRAWDAPIAQVGAVAGAGDAMMSPASGVPAAMATSGSGAASSASPISMKSCRRTGVDHRHQAEPGNLIQNLVRSSHFMQSIESVQGPTIAVGSTNPVKLNAWRNVVTWWAGAR
ncbi:MAG: hypothetical protein R3A10_09825 [Caldilineaceae bacterium]